MSDKMPWEENWDVEDQAMAPTDNAVAAAPAPWEDPAVVGDQPTPEQKHEEFNQKLGVIINTGGSKDDVARLSQEYGVDVNAIKGIDEALAWRASHEAQVPVITNPAAPTPAMPVEDQGALNAGVLGAVDTIGFGGFGEAAAAIGAASNSVQGVFGGGTGEDFGDYYHRLDNENQGAIDAAQDYHPYAFGAGQLAGGIAASPFTGGTTVAGIAGRAALEGAAYGFGSGRGGVEDRLTNAAKGGAMGLVGGGILAGGGKFIAPRVSDSVARLLDRGVPLTPGQIIGAKGGVTGATARLLENGLKAFPLVGGQVQKAHNLAAESVNRIGAKMAGGQEALRNMLPPIERTRIFEEAANDVASLEQRAHQAMIARDPGAAQLAADATQARNRLTALGATKGANEANVGARDLQTSIADHNIAARGADSDLWPIDNEFRTFADDAATTMGNDSRIGSTLGDSLDKFAPGTARLLQLGLRASAGVGSFAAAGPGAIGGAVLGAGAYTQPGQRILRSVVAGRQNPVARAIRSGVEAGIPGAAPAALGAITAPTIAPPSLNTPGLNPWEENY